MAKPFVVLTLGLWMGLALPAPAQNGAPLVSNLAAAVDAGAGTVTFSYDLSDAENEDCEVSLRVSADSGRTWLAPVTNISGDAGFPVSPGLGKSIVWTFDAQLLANLMGQGGPRGFLARVVADDRQPVDLAQFAQSVDSARVMARLNFLEGVRHRTGDSVHLRETRDMLRSHLASQGLQDFSQPFSYQTYPSLNLIARQPGLTHEDSTYGISGHYDTVYLSPGADDNGTSIAAVAEAMEVLGTAYFHRTIRYMAFDCEEFGTVGSTRYVQNLPAYEHFLGLVNLEMVGYLDTTKFTQDFPNGFGTLFPAVYDSVQSDSFRGNFLTNVANVASHSLKMVFDSCARAFVPGLRVLSLETPGTGTMTPDLRRSDHAPFWDAGYPALMLTDGADTRNPFYHTVLDSVSTLDPGFLVQNVRAAVVTMARLAGPVHAGLDTTGYFEITLPTAVSLAETLDWRIFPNPNAGRFEIVSSVQGEIELRDLQGRRIEGLGWGTQVGDRWTWTVSTQIPAGIYLVRLRHAGGVAEKKWVVE